MKLSYSVVAYDDSGSPIKEILRTIVKSKAKAKLEELDAALEERSRRLGGVKVAEYKLVSEPV